MRLNLGCGQHKPEGYVNVDRQPAASPDQLWDLEVGWPVADGVVEEISARHILEHLHSTNHFMKEAYRVMVPGAPMTIVVPHPRSDAFYGDPTHVRPITYDTLCLYSKENCREFREARCANTPLADYLDIDFRVISYDVRLQPRWADMKRTKRITDEGLEQALSMYNNVADELTFILERV